MQHETIKLGTNVRYSTYTQKIRVDVDFLEHITKDGDHL
jgi:hypothetical protein